MNFAKPIGRARAATAEPVRILVIGSRQNVQDTIDHLCKLHFCDHADWSKINAKHDSPGDWMSILTKWKN
jgi:hypothetical protein